ncbi:uncharacterized protein LOC125840799 [Solanum verrucosum]|uniref:uncharacterized protein LOC125840799 n=1 Tax=Solanum verrucosum TaxID=315347 RepID=UPI0020D124C4|nr:uncharacterized protein LOC125840799 [Solanum verrucosum]
MSGGASSKSIVTGVHPFGSFNMDVDCLKEMGEFREWMNEGRRPRNKDRGIYVALFAARFICGSNVFDNEFDVNTQRIKFGSLLWNYGKMKLEKHITSESKSSGIIKKMDCMKRYYN